MPCKGEQQCAIVATVKARRLLAWWQFSGTVGTGLDIAVASRTNTIWEWSKVHPLVGCFFCSVVTFWSPILKFKDMAGKLKTSQNLETIAACIHLLMHTIKSMQREFRIWRVYTMHKACTCNCTTVIIQPHCSHSNTLVSQARPFPYCRANCFQYAAHGGAVIGAVEWKGSGLRD